MSFSMIFVSHLYLLGLHGMQLVMSSSDIFLQNGSQALKSQIDANLQDQYWIKKSHGSSQKQGFKLQVIMRLAKVTDGRMSQKHQ